MRRNGWFRESHRHSLAARGIKTNRYMKYKKNDYLMGKFMISKKALEYIPEEHHKEAIRLMAEGVPTKQVIRTFVNIPEHEIKLKESSGEYNEKVKLGSKEKILERLKEIGRERGRAPRMVDYSDVYSIGELNRMFGSFGKAVNEAAEEEFIATRSGVDDPRLFWFQQGLRKEKDMEELNKKLGLSEEQEMTEEQKLAVRRDKDEEARERNEREFRAMLLRQQIDEMKEEVEDLKAPFTEGTPGMDVSADVMKRQEEAMNTKEQELRELELKAKDNGFLAKKRKEFIIGGRADGKPDSIFPKDQLKKGIKVEIEHTHNPAMAKEIAKDHLTEDPKYYDKLEKMEATFEKLPKNMAYPITPYEAKRVLARMPEERTKGLKGIEFTKPDKIQKDAWAQYLRGRRKIKIFAQPVRELNQRGPAVVHKHMVEYVIPHEVGHHRALRGGKTDKSLAMAEARADANVVGMDPFDKDVKKLKMK